ncbi:MAG: 2Fe-2S iron-sulfur cluster-binding protein [Pseudomonadota bacterium]
MVNMTIDGNSVQAKEGASVLQKIHDLRIDMPTLCYHPELAAFGACRLCMVEVKANGKWQLAAACELSADQGLEVKTASDKAVEARKLAAELLYFKYPTTVAVRDIAVKLGVAVAPAEGDGHDCILCGLCTRTCRDVVGVSALTFVDCGLGRNVVAPKIEFTADKCIGCGSCAYICPTGYVKMEAVDDKRMIWNKVFKMAACNSCGRYFAPIEQLEYISRTTGTPMAVLSTCMSCR